MIRAAAWLRTQSIVGRAKKEKGALNIDLVFGWLFISEREICLDVRALQHQVMSSVIAAPFDTRSQIRPFQSVRHCMGIVHPDRPIASITVLRVDMCLYESTICHWRLRRARRARWHGTLLRWSLVVKRAKVEPCTQRAYTDNCKPSHFRHWGYWHATMSTWFDWNVRRNFVGKVSLITRSINGRLGNWDIGRACFHSGRNGKRYEPAWFGPSNNMDIFTRASKMGQLSANANGEI